MDPICVSRKQAANLSKYRSLVTSLALLFELADNENLDAVTEVSLAHSAQAAAWCDYLEAHARRVYGCIVSPELHAARERANHAATALYARLKKRRFALLDELHSLSGFEVKAHEAGVSHPATWGALALVYAQRSVLLAELAMA
jgi:hypothetical protein